MMQMTKYSAPDGNLLYAANRTLVLGGVVQLLIRDVRENFFQVFPCKISCKEILERSSHGHHG